jgi:hypothetical protein
MTLAVPYEELEPGPIGRKLAVVDYDASNGVWYEPVDLDERHVLLRNGLPPSEADPRFHQQMVYAVASETIRRFEFALGREMRWRQRRRNGARARLRIFPHAFQRANAFFDANLNALLFGYFSAERENVGAALPGQTVFTCLSHDIVAHETTHAIIHSLRGHFSEQTSLDPPAFHEAFADIVALFQHFAIKEALINTVRRTGGDLHRGALRPHVAPANGAEQGPINVELTEANPLVGVARQFGDAIGTRRALREALGKPADPALLSTAIEPHERGSILVAAVFDAFFSVYIETTRPLMRVAFAGGAVGSNGDLHPDLVEMLAQQAAKIAERFLAICIRAIDYCPPVDIQFGEFLRALISADMTLVPDDPRGYREAVITAFRRRGIVPEDVSSYSEESLCWRGPGDRGQSLPPIEGLHYDVLTETTEKAIQENAKRATSNAVLLNKYAVKYADELGLARGPNGNVTVQPWTFHPVYRIGPDGRLLVEFVVEFLQQREERLDPNDLASPGFVFRGGSTVIFNHRGEVRFVIDKRLASDERLRQRDYLSSLSEHAAASAFTTRMPLSIALNFAALHRGC